MTFLANPHEVSFRFGDYIDEFQAILATNNIKHGAPGNFSTFARRLQSDELLSADLDRMVRSIIQRESGNVSLRTILTIIAIASGGDAIAEVDRDLSKPMQLVIDAMIASGGCSPGDPNHLDDLCRSTTPEDTPTFLAEPSPTPNLDDSASDLNQSLTRLERNAVEAKHYLESIEQRISHIEPFFEAIPHSNISAPSPNVAPIPYPTKPPIPNRLAVLLSDSIARFTIHFNDSMGRFTQFLFSQKSSFRNYSSIFFSDTFTHKLSDIQKQFDTTLTTFTDNFFSYSFTDKLRTYSFAEKLFSYSFTEKIFNYRLTDNVLNHTYTDKFLNHPYTQKLLSYKVSNQLIQRAAAVPLSVAAIVGGTLLYLAIERKPHPIIQSTTASVIEAAAVAPTIPATDHPQLTVYAEPLDKPIAKPYKPSPNLPETTTIIPTYPQRPTSPAPTATTSPVAAAVTTPTASPNAAEADPISTQATAHNAKYAFTSLSSKFRPSPSHAIDVSSGIMASNLVSATPPTYPKLASLIHMQGKVVMQAIIAENGTVQSLQVLQGHHLLRGAAKSAVHSWRYRPYLIDDKPVEIATIVTVDFNLQH